MIIQCAAPGSFWPRSLVAEPHSLPNGHAVGSNAALWQQQMDAFLKAIEQPQ
jgi:hypothetical protein